MRELKDYFEKKIEVPLIRYGKKQRIETLINEEALLLAKYIRNEIKTMESKSLNSLVILLMKNISHVKSLCSYLHQIRN
jgi:uncharacterized protein (DUF2384 family)